MLLLIELKKEYKNNRKILQKYYAYITFLLQFTKSIDKIQQKELK